MNELNPDLFDDRDELPDAMDEEDFSLQRLHYWLKWEGLSGFLLPGSFFLPYGFLTGAVIIGAAVFTPFLLWHLVKARWYRAIAIFVVLVCVPASMALFFKWTNLLMTYFWIFLPLVCFYIYTWTLRFVIGEYLHKKQAVRQFEAIDRRRRQRF